MIDITQNILNWQLKELFEVRQIIGYTTILLIFGLVFFWLALSRNFDGFSLDGRISNKEKEFYGYIARKYFLWALLQQVIVITILSALGLKGWPFALAGAAIFGIVYHFPNFLLMAITFFLGFTLYSLYYFADFQSLLYIALVHATGGTALKYLGFDLSAWWRNDNWSKMFGRNK